VCVCVCVCGCAYVRTHTVRVQTPWCPDLFCVCSAAVKAPTSPMATNGPARSEGNLTASPRQQGVSQGASLALSRGAIPSSCPQSCRGPSAQGNEPPAQGDGLPSGQDYGRTSAQGSGPRRSPGQDWTPAQGDGLPSDQGYGRPCAQGVGPLPHQGKGGVCNTNSEPSEPANSASESSINSVDSADSETNDQIYNFGSLTIVLNTILCFIATKKLWARMLLCEQLKKHYAPEDIAEAHNIVIELSDARRPRLTTRDTKRMINVTVHTMLDDLVDNKNIIASTTTEAPSTKISSEFRRLSQKNSPKRGERTQAHCVSRPYIR